MILTLAGPISQSDLGYLLHKNPARVHTFDLSFGQAHVAFPASGASLILDVDPVGLVRSRGSSARDAFTLGQYVNDRPYSASSFLSVAIAQVFREALSGKSKERQQLADAVLAWTATVASVPCRGGEVFLRRLFEPLGYAVEAVQLPLDEKFPEWGSGVHFRVRISRECRLTELLTQLYVLIPVLDADKHYWVGEAEVGKLLSRGAGWLDSHPERDAIVKRYLQRRPSLMRMALERLEVEAPSEEDTAEEAPITPLWKHRIVAATEVLKAAGARRVIDLGCGEGKLLRAWLNEPSFTELVGMDVSHRSLEIAELRLRSERVKLLHGSLMYRDERIAGFDGAAIIEVIEHLDPPRLAAFERVVFAYARPATVVITTPNAEYNVRYESLAEGEHRHSDHRFEWTRKEFESWASRVASDFGYRARFDPVGEVDPDVGAPTQMGVFSR